MKSLSSAAWARLWNMNWPGPGRYSVIELPLPVISALTGKSARHRPCPTRMQARAVVGPLLHSRFPPFFWTLHKVSPVPAPPGFAICLRILFFRKHLIEAAVAAVRCYAITPQAHSSACCTLFASLSMHPEVVLKSIELIRAAKIAEVYRYCGKTIVVVIHILFSSAFFGS